jgi:hypothetical protein
LGRIYPERYSEDQAIAKTRSTNPWRYWWTAIERQQASGQSTVGVCAKEGLSPASFHAWKRRLRRPPCVIRRKEAKEPLLPVKIINDPVGGVGKRCKQCQRAASRITTGSTVAYLLHHKSLGCPARVKDLWRRDGLDAPIEIPFSPKTAKRKIGVQQKGSAFTPGPAPKGRGE